MDNMTVVAEVKLVVTVRINHKFKDPEASIDYEADRKHTRQLEKKTMAEVHLLLEDVPEIFHAGITLVGWQATEDNGGGAGEALL